MKETTKRIQYQKPKALSLSARKVQTGSKPAFKAECSTGGFGDPPKCSYGTWP